MLNQEKAKNIQMMLFYVKLKVFNTINMIFYLMAKKKKHIFIVNIHKALPDVQSHPK